MPPATILCIDDEPDALKLRCTLLEKAGYRVFSAGTPPQVISLFSAEHIDIVVLDYWMPGMKGIQIAERLKGMKPRVPIIMFSGYRSIGDEGIGRVERWLMKGESEPEDLLCAVRELLASHQTP